MKVLSPKSLRVLLSVASTGAFRVSSLADSPIVTVYKARITATDNTLGQIVKGRMSGLTGYGSSVCNLRGVSAGAVCLEIRCTRIYTSIDDNLPPIFVYAT